jgi:DNA topoisomerase-1
LSVPRCWQLLLLLFLTSERRFLLQTQSSFISSLLNRASALPSAPQLCSRQHVLATAAAASTQAAGASSSSGRGKGAARTTAAKAAAVADKTALVSSGRTGGKSLMIVESPTKATKIQKFLGDEYKVCW